jgi:UDP:flavonoid glycosyltransferase YjiC (YdhE family)
MFFGALLLLCRPADLRPPVVNLGIVPLALHSRHTAPFALGIPPRDGALGQVRNVLLGWVTDHLVFGGLHRTAARMARERTGFPLRAHATDYISLADAIVQFTVADFEYPRPDSGTPVHFVGPMTRRTAPDAPPEALPAPVAGDAHPVPPWWGDLAAAREAGVPIVHLTQGTIANADPEDLILPTVRALAEERVLVVVSSAGRSIPASQLPANVRVADFLPYDLLFPQLSALVTNGGYGGVQFALAHGVPVVAIGNTEDKAEVAARVAWSGAGLRLRPSRTGGVDPDVVGAAVRRVLAESAFRTRCRQLAAAIAASPGPQGIEAVLDEVTAPCHVPADLTRH